MARRFSAQPPAVNRQAKFHDPDANLEEIYQCCMFFATVYEDIVQTVPAATLKEIVAMFENGSSRNRPKTCSDMHVLLS